jgi:hypothetical protein
LCRLIDTAESLREQCTIPLGNKVGLMVTPARDDLREAAAELAERHAELDALRGFSTGQPPGASTQQDDLPPITCSDSTPGAERAVTRGAMKEPPQEAFVVYRYWFATGKTQKELADDPRLMEKLGRKVEQGTISRWQSKVRRWIEAGNILPPFPRATSRSQQRLTPKGSIWDRTANIDRSDRETAGQITATDRPFHRTARHGRAFFLRTSGPDPSQDARHKSLHRNTMRSVCAPCCAYAPGVRGAGETVVSP